MAKRGQNEGSIYKRDDGRWTAEITLGYEGNRRQRKWLYGRTRQEVARKLNAALQARSDGIPQPNERLTVGQFLTKWLAETAKPSVRPTTYESYESYVRLHLVPSLGRFKLARLTPADVQHYLNDRLAAGARPRTVQYERAILRRALGHAMKWGLVARNAATLVDPPRVTRAEVPALSPADAQRLLTSMKGNALESLVILALATGMRQGELLGLRWDDVDLGAGLLHVRAQMQRIDGRLQRTEPKTAKSRRIIALPEVGIAALRAQRTRRIEDRLVAGVRWQETGLVFASTVGTPLDATNVTHRFQAALAKAGLPKMRFHDLRHGAASLLLAQGVSPRVVMETLGHSQISLTLNTYSHVIPELKREAAERMDAVLGGSR